MTTIIAIDPAMTATGVAVYRNGDVQLATIRTEKADGRIEARWRMILRGIAELTPYERPCMAAIEEYPWHMVKLGARGAADRLGLRALLLDQFYGVGIETLEVNVKTIKLYAGAGDSDKSAMRAAALTLGAECRDSHQADAYVLMRMTLHAAGFPPMLPEGGDQRDAAVAAVEWPHWLSDRR